MPRKEQTTACDVVGDLELQPVKVVADYVESKQQNNLFIKPMNWHSAGDSIELLFLQNREELEAMREQHKDLLKANVHHDAANHLRTVEILKSQDNLRNQFSEVNNFIRECRGKRYKAIKTIDEECDKQEEIKLDIIEVGKKVDILNIFRKDLLSTVQQYEPYEMVTERVVQLSDLFQSSEDCTSRCDALMLAQAEINEVSRRKFNEIEQMRQSMLKIAQQAALSVLGMKNDLLELERKYTQAQIDCKKWESLLSGAMKTRAENEFMKKLTLESLRMLFLTLCKRRNIPKTICRYSPECMLDFIYSEVQTMKEIIHEMSGDDTAKTERAEYFC